MSAAMTEERVEELLKTEVLWKGMQLEELGHAFEDLHGETQILGENGLGLDSVDSLEIVVKIQKTFNLQIGDVSKDFFETHLRTINTLKAFILDSLSVN